MIMTRRTFLKLGSAVLLSLAAPGGAAAAAVRIPVLMYHDLAAPAHEFETVAPAAFAAQMEWLFAEGYRSISVAELGALHLEEAGKVVLITADDGHASFVEYAFSLLQEYGFKATVTITARYAGGFRDEDHPRLSWDECRYLAQSGLVEIGCHTYDLHDRDAHLTSAADLAAFNDRLGNDLLQFQRTYQQEMGRRAAILAWPYGRYDRRSVEIARAAGFTFFLTSDDRHVMQERDRYEVPRRVVYNTMDLEKFRDLVEGRP